MFIKHKHSGTVSERYEARDGAHVTDSNDVVVNRLHGALHALTQNATYPADVEAAINHIEQAINEYLYEQITS